MRIDVNDRERAVEAIDILNDFIGDCVASVNVFRDYWNALKDDASRQNMLVAVHRLCMSYLLVTLDKWLEFYDRYHGLIPSDLHDECKKLMKELRSRKIEDFRDTCIGHIWNKKTKRPLYSSEIDVALKQITKGDINGFLKWVNDPNNNVFPSTIVSIVETVRDRIAREHNIDYQEITSK